MLHQFGGRQIIYLPQARHDAPRSGVHKPASQSDEALAFDLFAQSGLAGAQDHEVGGHFQVEDFAHSQKAVLWFSIFIHERKHQTREFRMFTVDQAVSGEMNDAVLAQLSACGELTVSFEACGFERRTFWRKPRDEFGFLVGKNEAAEAVTMKAPSRTLKLGSQRGRGGRRFRRSDTGDQTV